MSLLAPHFCGFAKVHVFNMLIEDNKLLGSGVNNQEKHLSKTITKVSLLYFSVSVNMFFAHTKHIRNLICGL